MKKLWKINLERFKHTSSASSSTWWADDRKDKRGNRGIWRWHHLAAGLFVASLREIKAGCLSCEPFIEGGEAALTQTWDTGLNETDWVPLPDIGRVCNGNLHTFKYFPDDRISFCFYCCTQVIPVQQVDEWVSSFSWGSKERRLSLCVVSGLQALICTAGQYWQNDIFQYWSVSQYKKGCISWGLMNAFMWYLIKISWWWHDLRIISWWKR